MKFLHTADWHLGKVLHHHSLKEEMALFFDWLEATLISEEVNVLLVSGDIFDISNPASEYRRMYYQLVARLMNKVDTIIITGGNHDSAAMLDAPSDLMEALNIYVIGSIDPDNLEKEIIPLYKDELLQAIVLAVPYPRDRDVRAFVSSQSSSANDEDLRRGILHHYKELVALAREKYSDKVPIIAMGHLFIQGVQISDSEREIRVGNLSGIDYMELLEMIDYMALGHIHRPQSIDHAKKIRYSGSPIALSFSEQKDEKTVIIGHITDNIIQTARLRIPSFRKLITLEGNIEEVKAQIKTLHNSLSVPMLVELFIKEPNYQPEHQSIIQEIKKDNLQKNWIVVKDRIVYDQQERIQTDLLAIDVDVDSITPSRLFDHWMQQQDFDSVLQEAITNLYNEIVEEVLNNN